MQNKNVKVIIFLLLPTFTMINCSKIKGICDNVSDVVTFLPYPDDCSRYIICILWYPSVVECQPGTIFNEITIICEPGEK